MNIATTPPNPIPTPIPNAIKDTVGNTKTTERGGESVVYELKQFYAF